MKCGNCGAMVKDEDVICPSCGAELSKVEDASLNEAKEISVDEEVAEARTVNEEQNNIASEASDGGGNVEEDTESTAGELSSVESEGSGEEFEGELAMKPVRNKTGLIVALSALAVLILGLAVYVVFLGGFETITSLVGLGNNHPVVFVKDNAFYVKDGSRQNQKISGKVFQDESNIPTIVDESQYKNYTMVIKQKKNGNLLYFYDNISIGNDFVGDLNVYELGGKTKKVAQDVTLGLTLNAEGNSALFLENYKSDTQCGDLYLYTRDGKTEKLGSGVRMGAYNFSSDGKTLAYVDNSEKDDNKWNLYVKSDGTNKEKIDTGKIALVDVENGGNKVVYAKGNEKNSGTYDLYVKEKGKDTKCVANTIADVTVDKKNQSLFVIADFDMEKQYGNLYYKELNKDKVKVDEKVLGLIKLGVDKFEPDVKFLGNQNSDALYVKNYNQEKGTGDMYLKHANDKTVKVASDIGLGNIQFTNDLMTIAYYRTDAASGELTLFTANASEDKSSFKEKSISDKLPGYGNVSKKGNVIVYTKKASDGTKYDLNILNPDGKSEKIGNGVTGTGKLSDDGKYVLFEEENNGVLNLFLKQPGKSKMLVASGLTSADKYYTYDYKKIYYTKGYDETKAQGELYVKETGKAASKIDSGVSIVLYSE